MRTNFLIWLSIFGAGTGLAQSEVSGVVRDQNGPLPQANIVVQETGDGRKSPLFCTSIKKNKPFPPRLICQKKPSWDTVHSYF